MNVTGQLFVSAALYGIAGSALVMGTKHAGMHGTEFGAVAAAFGAAATFFAWSAHEQRAALHLHAATLLDMGE